MFPYMYNQQIVRVNGENGAKAFQMAANSSALLLDETAPLVWLAQTDGAGYKTVSPYSITPYEAPKAPDLAEVLARLDKLEGVINDIKSNNSEHEQVNRYESSEAGIRQSTGYVRPAYEAESAVRTVRETEQREISGADRPGEWH